MDDIADQLYYRMQKVKERIKIDTPR